MPYNVKVTFIDETHRIFLDVSRESYSVKYYIFIAGQRSIKIEKDAIDYIQHIGKTGKDQFIYSDIVFDGGRQRIMR